MNAYNEVGQMYSIPVSGLVEMYQSHIHELPRSFFDCGCASGELIHQAAQLGMASHGIDIEQYQILKERMPYVSSGQIEIKSILDYGNVASDLAYANGTFAYLNEETLPVALSKFSDVKMLVAIHNTIEDVKAARKQGDELLHGKPRLIKPKAWWKSAFKDAGFKVTYNNKYNCFCLFPDTKKR